MPYLEEWLMALWKEPASAPPTTTVTELHKSAEHGAADAARRSGSPRAAAVESVIAAELTIEGKITGSGDVRIAGRFKGDVQVDGNFRIDAGARLEGQVRAS